MQDRTVRGQATRLGTQAGTRLTGSRDPDAHRTSPYITTGSQTKLQAPSYSIVIPSRRGRERKATVERPSIAYGCQASVGPTQQRQAQRFLIWRFLIWPNHDS